MNIYVRYFDYDTVATNYEEVIDFLASIPEIQITEAMVNEVRAYAESEIPYPKRYKIRPRVYFIMIKTAAQTLEEFKNHRKEEAFQINEAGTRKEVRATQLSVVQLGWYRGELNFKRVIQIPGTGKFQYQDTRFSALVWAESGQHCYDRIINYLKSRQDVDLRSQFPSVRGNSFRYEYMGTKLQQEEVGQKVGWSDNNPCILVMNFLNSHEREAEFS